MISFADIVYPKKNSLRFTFSFRNAGYACFEKEDRTVVCMKTKWNLWRGFFCPDEDLPREVLDICNQFLDENFQNPAKYPLKGEHYLVSCPEEGKIRIGFTKRKIMRGGRRWIPLLLRLFFTMLCCCIASFSVVDEYVIWLSYLFRPLTGGLLSAEAVAFTLIAAETIFLFCALGAPRRITFLFIIANIPIGTVRLLGFMKKQFLAALLIPFAIVFVYAVVHYYLQSVGIKRILTALNHSVFGVTLAFYLVTLFIGITPYSTNKKYEIPEIPAAVTERYAWACGKLDQFQEKSSAEKLDILQAVCDYECTAVFGCEPPKVCAGDTGTATATGCYVNSKRTITIRADYLDTGDTDLIVQTLMHEIRHHVQYRMVEMYLSLDTYLFEEYKNMSPFKEAASFLDNFNHYHNAEVDFDLYYGQTVEADSRAWAEERVKHYLPFIYGENDAEKGKEKT